MSNPLIQRYRYSTMRPKQFWIYVTIYICIVLLVVSLNYSGYKYQTFFEDIVKFHRGLYYQFLIFQTMILFVWSAYNSGSAIKEEILNKSFDFFRMLPLSAYKKAFGILLGKNLVVFLFGAINFVFLTYFGLRGGVNINLQGQIILIIVSVTILANSVALLSSINPAKKSKSSGVIFILLAVFFVMPMVINGIIALSFVDELESYSVYFFRMKIPILLLISFIALYFSCWAFKGIFRKFTYEQEPLFTRKGAVLFLLGYIFVAAGLCYNYISEMENDAVHLYWFLTLVPIFLVPLGSLRSLDRYIEYSRFIQGRSDSGEMGFISVLLYSNLALTFVLFAIWAVSAMAACLLAKYAAVGFILGLYNVFILFSSYLFLVLLLELNVIYNPLPRESGFF